MRATTVSPPRNQPSERWTRKQCFEALRALPAGCTVRAARKARPGLPYVARKFWGTWTAALVAAGVRPSRPGARRKWTREEVIAQLRRRARNELGVRTTDLLESASGLLVASRRLFGSVDAALRAARVRVVRGRAAAPVRRGTLVVRPARRVTQSEIARRLGVDVSTVNKILNEKAGAKFQKTTVDAVLRAARELGYDFDRRKYTHRRTHPRRRVDAPAELRIVLPDGSTFDRGRCQVGELSEGGAHLEAIDLPGKRLPLGPFTVVARITAGPLAGVTLRTRPVRVVTTAGRLQLGVQRIGPD